MAAGDNRADRFPEYLFLRTNMIRMREGRGWTQGKLADQLERLDQSYISALERMQINPSLEVLSAIAAGLEVDVADLLQPVVETPSERKRRLLMERKAELAQAKREAERLKKRAGEGAEGDPGSSPDLAPEALAEQPRGRVQRSSKRAKRDVRKAR